MTDMIVPGFKERSANGEVFNNPMSKEKWERTMTPGGFSFHNYGTGTQNFDDTYDGFYAIDRMGGVVGHAIVPMDISSLLTTAGTQAKGNIASPTFDGLTFVGELHETLHFFRNPLKGYVDFLKRMRSKKNSTLKYKSKTVFDFVSDQWLSYRYAVRPLVYDAQKIGEAVGRMSVGKPKRSTARGEAHTSGSQSFTIEGNGYAANARRTGVTNQTVDVRCGVLYEEHFSADVYGTHLQQIPTAMWELLPYSFIADWFFNIGDYVKAVTPKYRVRELASWTVIKDVKRTSSDCFIYSLDDAADTILNPGHCSESLVTETTSRTPGISIGLTAAPWARSLAGMLAPLDVSQITDLVAIARQLNRSR